MRFGDQIENPLPPLKIYNSIGAIARQLKMCYQTVYELERRYISRGYKLISFRHHAGRKPLPDTDDIIAFIN